MILTVTANAAVDKTLTGREPPAGPPPSRPAGHRDAGRQGHQRRARAQALGEPVVATGLAGGRTGSHIVDAHGRGGDRQRVRAHRRRVAHLDGGGRSDQRRRRPRSTSTAPRWRAEELDVLQEKLRYLPGAVSTVVLAGSLPRKVPDGLLRRRVARRERKVRAVIDSDGEPLRLAWPPSPALVSPTSARPRRSSATSSRPTRTSWTRSADRRDGRRERPDHAAHGLLRAAARGPRRAACSAPGSRSWSRVGGRLGRRAAGGLPGRLAGRAAARGVPALRAGLRRREHPDGRRRRVGPARRAPLRGMVEVQEILARGSRAAACDRRPR